MVPLSFPISPQRILIIKPSAIGDVVHALPVLNLVRRKWPAARISWLVTPACAGLLEGHPQLDEVIRFERRHFGQSWRSPAAARGLFRFTRDLRQREFDMVIDLQGLFRSGWLAARTGAKTRIGFANARELGWVFYTHRVPVETMEQHAIDRYLAVAEALGCGRGPTEYIFPTTQVDRDAVARMLPPEKRYAVLLPGTNWESKRWPVENFAALVRPLRQRFELESVVAGAAADAELAAGIPGAVDLTGKTSLRELVALLERADLVLANDSGPMHIAAALGRPLIVPFGPTDPIRTGPYRREGSVVRLEISCSPCYSRHCLHLSCLRLLEVEPVLSRAAEELRRAKDAPRHPPSSPLLSSVF